jgi:hypothetical protein
VNEADVTRYPDEKTIDPPKKVKLVWNVGRIHVAPMGNSKVVTVLAKDTEVMQLAQRPSGYVLITFPDPKRHSDTMMGWIFKDAFTGSPMHVRLIGGKCPAGYVRDADRCAKKCSQTEGCADGYFCGGVSTQYCIFGE